MATTGNVALPPISKIAVIGIWIETVLYGVNCVMYGLCMFTLLRGGKTVPVRWMLVVMSSILFLLCTAFVGTSLRQLLEAFVYVPPGVPSYSTLYWLNLYTIPRALKGNLFATQLLCQDVILIWRLYVVFARNWKVIILPIILAVGSVGSTFAAVAPSTTYVTLDHGSYNPVLTSLVISAYVCGFTLNATVTGGIVFRLWRMGRSMASFSSTNRFSSIIYMVVESGAISAVSNAVVLALFASNSLAALFGPDVVSQLITLTPLLIVVQVGQTAQDRVVKGNLSETVSEAPDTIQFRPDISSESGQGLPLDTMQFRSSSPAHNVDV